MNEPGETVVVALEGEIDLSTAPEAERRISAAAGTSPARIVIDLREVTFIDSSGLRVLLSAHRDAESNGRGFAIVKGNSAVDRLLELTGFAERLELLDEPPG